MNANVLVICGSQALNWRYEGIMNIVSRTWHGAIVSYIAITLVLATMTCLEKAHGMDLASTADPSAKFHVFSMDKDTYAIAEPKYGPEKTVSYLLVGKRRALLFDTGLGIHSIRKVVRSLTKLPLIVIPSHLHFDHVGNLHEFDSVWLLDTPALRAQVHDGYFTETSPQFLLRSTERFRVRDWFRDHQNIELGNRSVIILSTPGHTPDSVSLVESSRRRMFTGDLVNREVTLCNVPGADIHEMAKSVLELIEMAPPGSSAYEAHAEIPLQPRELKKLAAGLSDIAKGQASSIPACLQGLPMKRYNIGAFPILLPAEDGNTLRPLGAATEKMDWLNEACGEKAP